MGKAYVHTVIDDHSRVAYAEIHDDEAALTAAAVLVRPVSPFPIHQCHHFGASSVPPVARSADPEQFARNVATTLFAGHHHRAPAFGLHVDDPRCRGPQRRRTSRAR